ncbi:unnamed protein product [Prorocentrum cordatum]|uniref:XPG-I domain-containing protein n=1 Tax=Prorocentrum cordatum TaxID=2364126 RepID=A0ABN9TA89_9DINO|nr:unnamed protein product [Polarella glacialis]
MGVRGLTTFVSPHNRGDLWTREKLERGTRIIIDGPSFTAAIVTYAGGWKTGGDTSRLAAACFDLLSLAKDSGIEMHFVFDGISGTDKHLTLFNRRLEAYNTLLKVMSGEDVGRQTVSPEFSIGVVIEVLELLEIDRTFCHGEADATVAWLGKSSTAYVVSSDSDLMLADSSGYISCEDFIEGRKVGFVVQVLHRHSLLRELQIVNSGFSVDDLSLWASLRGNDYIFLEDLERFHSSLFQKSAYNVKSAQKHLDRVTHRLCSGRVDSTNLREINSSSSASNEKNQKFHQQREAQKQQELKEREQFNGSARRDFNIMVALADKVVKLRKVDVAAEVWGDLARNGAPRGDVLIKGLTTSLETYKQIVQGTQPQEHAPGVGGREIPSYVPLDVVHLMIRWKYVCKLTMEDPKWAKQNRDATALMVTRPIREAIYRLVMSNRELDRMSLQEETYPDSAITLCAAAAAEPLILSEWPWCLAPDADNGAAFEGFDTKRYMLEAMGWPPAMYQELDNISSAKRLPLMALTFAVVNNQHSFNWVNIAAIVTMFSTSHARRKEILKEWELGKVEQPMPGPTHDFGLYRSSLSAADKLSQCLQRPLGPVGPLSEWHDGTFLHSFFNKARKDSGSGIRVSTFLNAEELNEFKAYMITLFGAMEAIESNTETNINVVGRFIFSKADGDRPDVFFPTARK